MTATTPTEEIPVLIVGAGIVGLTASLLLSHHHSIPTLVLERHKGTSIHPRARSLNARSMEIFRRVGDVSSQIVAAGAALAPTRGMYAGRSLAEVIGPKSRASASQGGKGREMPFKGLLEGVSTGTGGFVTQDLVEPVLVEAVRARGGEVRFNTECVDVVEDEDGESVTATVRDRASGATSEVRARYVIAADGARSPIRERFGVPVSGRGTLGHLLNVLFVAELGDFVRGREFSLVKIESEEVCGLFTSINNGDRWVFHLAYDPARGQKAEDYTPERCVELLRVALGMPDVDIEIKSILLWEPSVRVAERFQVGESGRVFLAGDAAHQMPPWAGQGANSGIADAHNLVWKLAAVLRGEAGRELLGTYEVERRPVGRAAAEASAAAVDGNGIFRLEVRWDVLRGFLGKMAIVSGHGYGYEGAGSVAVCDESRWPLGGITWTPWNVAALFFGMDGRPGRRVPHVWVEKGGKRISTLDVLGRKFVLFVGEDGGTEWVGVAKQVGGDLGIDIDIYTVGPTGDLVCGKGVFDAAAEIAANGAVVVRPDDFVAWRERRMPTEPRVRLEVALRQVLAR